MYQFVLKLSKFIPTQEMSEMLYNYKEAVKLFGNDYKLRNAIYGKHIFKIEKGIYSDGENNFTITEVILKKYSHAFLVKDSALYYIGFIEKPPTKIHIGTPRNALRIKDERVQQHFYSNLDITVLSEDDWFRNTHLLSHENIKTYTTGNGNQIRIFNPKALFFDVIRDRTHYSKADLFDLLDKFENCRYLYGLTEWELECNLRRENDVGNIEFLDEDLCKKLKKILGVVRQRDFDFEMDALLYD